MAVAVLAFMSFPPLVGLVRMSHQRSTLRKNLALKDSQSKKI
jgi:hypothetical protein